MILSNHDVSCPSCLANNKCELQTLANNLGVDPEKLPNILEKNLLMKAHCPLLEMSINVLPAVVVLMCAMKLKRFML